MRSLPSSPSGSGELPSIRSASKSPMRRKSPANQNIGPSSRSSESSPRDSTRRRPSALQIPTQRCVRVAPSSYDPSLANRAQIRGRVGAQEAPAKLQRGAMSRSPSPARTPRTPYGSKQMSKVWGGGRMSLSPSPGSPNSHRPDSRSSQDSWGSSDGVSGSARRLSKPKLNSPTGPRAGRLMSTLKTKAKKAKKAAGGLSWAATKDPVQTKAIVRKPSLRRPASGGLARRKSRRTLRTGASSRPATAPSNGGHDRPSGGGVKNALVIEDDHFTREERDNDSTIPDWLSIRPDYMATMNSHATLYAAVLRHAHSRGNYEVTTIGDWLRAHVHLDRFMSVGMSGKFMNEFTRQLRGRKVLKGEVIFYEGDTVLNDFYIVLTGWFEVVVDLKVVAMLGSGDTFGHLALVRHKSSLHAEGHELAGAKSMARTASVVAASDGVVMELNAIAFDELMRAFNTKFRTSTIAYLKEHSAFFEPWNRARLYRIVGHMKEVSYKKGDVVIEEGTPAKFIFFVRSGRVRLNSTYSNSKVWRVPLTKVTWQLHEEVVHHTVKILDLGDGQVFGTAASMAHMHEGTMRYLDYAKNAVALEDCTVLKLSATLVAEVFPSDSQRVLRERFIELRNITAAKITREASATQQQTRKSLDREAVMLRGPRYVKRKEAISRTNSKGDFICGGRIASKIGSEERAQAESDAALLAAELAEKEAQRVAVMNRVMRIGSPTKRQQRGGGGGGTAARPLATAPPSAVAKNLGSAPAPLGTKKLSGAPPPRPVTGSYPTRQKTKKAKKRRGSKSKYGDKRKQLLKVQKFKTAWGDAGDHTVRAPHEEIAEKTITEEQRRVAPKLSMDRIAEENRVAKDGREQQQRGSPRAVPDWLAAIHHELKLKKAQEMHLKGKKKQDYSPECIAASLRLHEAAKRNSTEECKAVLKEGVCDVNWPNTTGATALIHSCWSGPMELIELLVRNGANVNAQTSKGFSPLHFAYERGRKALGTYLVQSGARFLRTSDGKLPQDIAPSGFTSQEDTKAQRWGIGGSMSLPEFVTNEVVTYVHPTLGKQSAVVRAVDKAGEVYDNQYTIAVLSSNALAVVRFDELLKKPTIRSRIEERVTTKKAVEITKTFRSQKGSYDTPENLLQTLVTAGVSLTFREATAMKVDFPRRFCVSSLQEERKIVQQAMRAMHQARPGWKKRMKAQVSGRRHSLADLRTVLRKHAPTMVVRAAKKKERLKQKILEAKKRTMSPQKQAELASLGTTRTELKMSEMLRLVAKNQKLAEYRKTHRSLVASRVRRKEFAAVGMNIESTSHVKGEQSRRATITILSRRSVRGKSAQSATQPGPGNASTAQDTNATLKSAGGVARRFGRGSMADIVLQAHVAAHKDAAEAAIADEVWTPGPLLSDTATKAPTLSVGNSRHRRRGSSAMGISGAASAGNIKKVESNTGAALSEAKVARAAAEAALAKAIRAKEEKSETWSGNSRSRMHRESVLPESMNSAKPMSGDSGWDKLVAADAGVVVVGKWKDTKEKLDQKINEPSQARAEAAVKEANAGVLARPARQRRRSTIM